MSARLGNHPPRGGDHHWLLHPQGATHKCRSPKLTQSQLTSKLGVAVRFLLRRGPFHAALTNRARAFLSTGCHRITCGQMFKVPRRVEIAVTFEPALRATENSLRQRQLRYDEPTLYQDRKQAQKPAGAFENLGFLLPIPLCE